MKSEENIFDSLNRRVVQYWTLEKLEEHYGLSQKTVQEIVSKKLQTRCDPYL